MNLPITTTSPLRRWTSSDRQLLPYTEWLPLNMRPRAVLVAVHGLGGAAKDFQPLGEALAAQGFAVQAMDMRGQGCDPIIERRGDLPNETAWIRDVCEFVHLAYERFPQVPVFLIGESLGGALLTHIASGQIPADEFPAGLIFMCPVVNFRTPPSDWMVKLTKFFLKIAPQFKVDFRWFVKGRKTADTLPLCRDEEFAAQVDHDPDKIQVFTLRFLDMTHRLVATAPAKAPQVLIPSLVLYSGRDLFIRTEQSEAFVQALGSPDKDSVFYPESCHLLLRDPVRAEVIAKISSWLAARSDALQPAATVASR